MHIYIQWKNISEIFSISYFLSPYKPYLFQKPIITLLSHFVPGM